MKDNVIKIIKITIVNLFTVARFVGAFLLPFIYMNNGSGICSIWTICLFLTDAIDGFLARILKSSTFFGSSMDALSDKLLSAVACVILGLTYNIMIFPIILEIAILLINYSTYRHGGNIQSSIIGKAKTLVLDICIVGSFVLLSLPTLNINSTAVNNIILNSPYYITIFGCISVIAVIIALLDYMRKNQIIRQDPSAININELTRIRKPLKEIMHDAFDTNYYLLHKDEGIRRQFYKANI